jgi:hypothetical protein
MSSALDELDRPYLFNYIDDLDDLDGNVVSSPKDSYSNMRFHRTKDLSSSEDQFKLRGYFLQ